METSSSLFNFFENLSSSDIEPDISNEETTDFSFHGDKKTIISSENIERCETDLSRTVPQFPNEFSDNNSCSVEEHIEVVMAVYWKRGKLGAAYYTCSDSQVHVLNDIVDVHPDFNNLKTLVSQVKPSQVLTCSGMADTFVQALSSAINGKMDSFNETSFEKEDEQLKKIFFMSVRKRDLNYDSCKRYILGMRFGFEPDTTNEDDHLLFVNSHIDLSQESMVVSFGMLVKYLEKYLPQINLNHEPLRIMFINHISICNLVSIDEATYKALQIFNPRVHPSAFKRNAAGSTKEGLSLFGVFNRCKSSAGIRRLREMFLNPSKDEKQINERLDAVEFCCKPQHQHIVQNLMDCIKKVESITGILANIYRTRASISNWRSLYSSLYNAILIGDICQKHSSHSKLLEKMANSITPNIHEVTHYMNQVIDFEESSLKNQFTVRSGVDRKLDLLRETYAQIPEVLVKVAELELEDLPSFVQQCSIIYITELGYLLSIPVWKGDGSDAADYTLPNFEVKFVVNNFVHYKTPRCSELDEVLGDSVASISNIESQIMITLIQFIHVRISDIVKVVKLVAELDCVISFSIIASENNYVRPKLTKERKIEIVQGRHPLQELCIDNFVPNYTFLGGDGHFMKIITGPNASGKSVYLKQVALIAYLAHIGSFVPAQNAEISILDHIHSRIQTVESVSTRMSAFLLDLKQMSHALYNTTPNSMVVVDEFGKGTTEIDGLSLLAASLIHFVERKDKCPFVLVSTHFHSLPTLLPESRLIKLQYMDYLTENDEIIYLHKIKDGVTGSSLTLLAARAAGLSEEAIKRAIEIQSSKGPLTCNPQLQITKHMMKEINYMKKIFKIVLNNEDNSADSAEYDGDDDSDQG
ncbi:hypothetical protein RUM43_003914 [Polyplax serrata]|uniref:DNA mismatch repair proteins mutS family domain-containing protein n=1 Tax=Polyplax serrata TaxID=468196 RepID=A0AAN8P375_POLSC